MRPRLVYLEGSCAWRLDDELPCHIVREEDETTLCGLSIHEGWCWSVRRSIFPLEVCPKCLDAARQAGLVKEDQAK